MSPRFLLLFLLSITSCSDQATNQIPKLLDAIDCDRREVVGRMQVVLETETKDRQNYKPLSAEVIPIRMRQPAKGYHGPTRGTYILMIERYPTKHAAEIRAQEYCGRYWERIPNPDGLVRQDSKSSVRCWALADGMQVYLLTTHAAMYSALEELTHGINTKLTQYLHEHPAPQ